MAHTVISIAGLTVGIDHLYKYTGNYVKDFAVSGKNADFSVSTNQDDIEFERRKTIEEFKYEGLEYPGFSDDYLECTAVYRKIADVLPRYSAFVFHGSAVAVDGNAYIFTAKSGTGKTTHTNLWLKNIKGSFIVNGDKPVLRFTEGKFFVCGTPWMGKEKMGENIMMPLRAVCQVNRCEENRIERASFSEMLPVILGQSYRSPKKDSLTQMLSIFENFDGNVDFYKLYCNMDDEAAIVSYRGMTE